MGHGGTRGGNPRGFWRRGASRGALVVAVCVAALPPLAASAGPQKNGGSANGGPANNAPAIAIVAPGNGATVSGTATIVGTASDKAAIRAVTVSVDSGTPANAAGTTSWTYQLNTASLSAGAHRVAAQLTDVHGGSASATITVDIAPPPPPPAPPSPPSATIASPATGASVSGPVSVSGTASSGVAIISVSAQLDDGPLQPASGTTSWSTSLDTANVPDGPHAVTVWATDASGRSAVSGIQIETHNTPACTPASSTATVSGQLFEDANRDGVFDVGDTALSGVDVHFIDATGTDTGHATTDANGYYTSSALAAGRYNVELDPSWWPSMENSWVPDTTGSLTPSINTCADGQDTVDFGLRPIAHSTNVAAPISTFTGPNGLTVNSYDDVASARLLFDELMTGRLIGPEAAFETIFFDISSTTTTGSSCSAVNGVYLSCASNSYISLQQWLQSGDYALFFEYGNHWNTYYTYLFHQGSLSDYYVERGVAANPNLGSGQAWSGEMLTDDWRQLFGSPTAQAVPPLNSSIPVAAQVSGLQNWLATTYRGQ